MGGGSMRLKRKQSSAQPFGNAGVVGNTTSTDGALSSYHEGMFVQTHLNTMTAVPNSQQTAGNSH